MSALTMSRPIHCDVVTSGPRGHQPPSPPVRGEGSPPQGHLRAAPGQHACLLGEDGGQRPQPHRQEQREGGEDSDHQPGLGLQQDGNWRTGHPVQCYIQVKSWSVTPVSKQIPSDEHSPPECSRRRSWSSSAANTSREFFCSVRPALARL